jgi:hypothetical protein
VCCGGAVFSELEIAQRGEIERLGRALSVASDDNMRLRAARDERDKLCGGCVHECAGVGQTDKKH